MANPKRPYMDYDYTPSNRDDKFLLLSEKRYTLGGPFKKVRYYSKGFNKVCGKQEEIKHGSDERIDRVKVLTSLVGHDETPIVTHRFKYPYF